MDKKTKKRTVIKRKTEEAGAEGGEQKRQKVMVRTKPEEKDKVEVLNQVVEVPVEQNQQIVHTGQLVEGNFEQPVFVNMKGEPVQLGPNTVILYEQSGNPSNFAFGGMWTMDQSGRIVMAETIYDVKGEPEEESTTFVQNTAEVSNQQVEQSSSFQQYEISNTAQPQEEYEVAIIEQDQSEDRGAGGGVITTEEQLGGAGAAAARWLNQKYDLVVRRLQLNHDAGVKLLHSASGCVQSVYLTTPAMQQAFNAVPQFLCIETGIEFNSEIPTAGGGGPAVRHTVTLFLAEDGNGRSVIVSAGISALIGDDVTWLVDTFKSCNPAWRQTRCVVCDPVRCHQVVSRAFPLAHASCSVWQAARACSRLAADAARLDGTAARPDTARARSYALAVLRGEHSPQQLQTLRRAILGGGVGSGRLWEALTRPGGAVHRLDSWLQPDNYTNILHKGLEGLVTKLTGLIKAQPTLPVEEFVGVLFAAAAQLEADRRAFAVARHRETENLKQSPTDTITQYAYNLMSHQTKLAQKCLDDRGGKRHSSAAICKYGTSTQECSCLFSKVYKLPCRHILMLTTELKVKTHIPFEPRWTVQHCLFGCDPDDQPPTVAGSAALEQAVEEHRIPQTQQIHQVGGVRQQQYVFAAPAGQQNANVSQVIFCGGGGGAVAGVSAPPVITSVLPAGGAVLTPHHAQ